MKTRIVSLIALSLITLNLSCFADGLSGLVALTNNYVARGTAQNYGNTPVTMINANYDYKGFYVGVFTANVDFEEDKLGIQENPTYQEVSFWGGYRFSINTLNKDIGVDLMAGSYNYLGDTFTALDMVEVKTAITIPFGKFSSTTSIGFTPDYFNILGQSIWVDTQLIYNINDKFSVSAGIGRQIIKDKGRSNVMPYNPRGYSYTTWNAGINYQINKNWSAELRYFDTDRHDLGNIYSHNPYGQNVAATIKFSF